MNEKNKKSAQLASSTTTKAATKTAKAIPKSTRFEDALSELESIVEKLESGEQTLDQSLAQFERGIGLTRFCQQSLTEADKKVKILLGEQNEESLQEFDDQQ